MAANAGETKVKLWEGICYPENMLDDWQEEIDDILQVPFAYAIHDIDHDQKSKQRKTHVHIIVVWGGNTTRKAIINVLNRLSADGKRCCSSAEPVNNIRHAYDYLIHDTASSQKKDWEEGRCERKLPSTLSLPKSASAGGLGIPYPIPISSVIFGGWFGGARSLFFANYVRKIM